MSETLFTVGPVEMFPETLEVAGRPVPYFRNDAFSQAMLECERLFLESLGCGDGCRLVTLTASGTGAMEAAIMNCLGSADRAIVVDGGTFGHRFAQMLEWQGIPHDVLSVPQEADLSPRMLEDIARDDHTALLVNMGETSIGKLYDMQAIAGFCRARGIFLVVDAVSTYLCDPIDFQELGIGLLLTGSQKALALAPGLSFCVLSPEAQRRAASGRPASMYFDFNDYLANGLRGQTPFTPAVGVAYQLLERLRAIDAAGGSASEVDRTRAVALDFRRRLQESGLPLQVPAYRLSNALTPVVFPGGGAGECNRRLVERGIVVNPCGGANADTMLRIAHMGNHTQAENAWLIQELAAALA